MSMIPVPALTFEEFVADRQMEKESKETRAAAYEQYLIIDGQIASLFVEMY